MLACYHDDIALHWFGRGPLAGSHRGKAAALGALAEQGKRARRSLVEIVDVLASDAHAIALVRERLERDGRAVELERVLVYRVRDGKLAECWVYDRDQRLVDDLLR
jgi:ketosteroid isomerase-like protein